MLQRIVLATLICLIVGQASPAVAEESAEELAARLDAVAKAYSPKFPATAPFDQKDWQTNKEYELIGDPAAKTGGLLVQAWTSFPLNLRTDGPGSNYVQSNQVKSLVYESLVGLHPNTLSWMPGLASYWQIKQADDGKSQILRFRINSRARWADGTEVTADDVLATWRHMVSADRKDPMNVLLYGEFHEPKIIDKHTIEVQTKNLNWRHFSYFGGMSIYPAKYVGCNGADYIRHYQWNMMMGSGPYSVANREKDFIDQESLTLTRRKDYWGWKERWSTGTNNFDKIKWVVIRELRIQFEKVKKGDIDWYRINKAQRWVEECDPATVSDKWAETLNKGWVLKRKIYTHKAQGFSGFVFNMRKKPFDDQRVRRAFAYLFNREKLIEKLFFNEYEILDSYWPAGPWGNKENPKIRYNPRRAAQLLAEAGYKTRNKAGWLVDADGNPFRVAMNITKSPSWERIMTVIKEDYAEHGIDLDMTAVDWRVGHKKIQERKFNLHYQSWGAGIFPSPKTMWSSELADKQHNNNIPGFKNARMDRYIDKFDKLMGVGPDAMAKRMKLIQRMDKIIFREYPYALGWYGPYTRIVYQNKFGHPKRYFSRFSYGDYRDIQSLWWIDPVKEAALKKAKQEGTALPVGEVVQRPWADKDSAGEKK